MLDHRAHGREFSGIRLKTGEKPQGGSPQRYYILLNIQDGSLTSSGK